jgi:hypothetical protein
VETIFFVFITKKEHAISTSHFSSTTANGRYNLFMSYEQFHHSCPPSLLQSAACFLNLLLFFPSTPTNTMLFLGFVANHVPMPLLPFSQTTLTLPATLQSRPPLYRRAASKIISPLKKSSVPLSMNPTSLQSSSSIAYASDISNSNPVQFQKSSNDYPPPLS